MATANAETINQQAKRIRDRLTQAGHSVTKERERAFWSIDGGDFKFCYLPNLQEWQVVPHHAGFQALVDEALAP